MKILNFGSLNIDKVYKVKHFVRPGETIFSEEYQCFPGGKGLNQSIAAARAGVPIYHAGTIGPDGRFLAELGLPVAAALVADHRDLSVPDAAQLTERELVYLADKYCHGREFVPLELRFGQKLDLYAADPAACAAIRGRLGRARALEARLAREMGRPPADIARQALEALLKAKGGEPEAEPNSSRGDT